MKPMLLAAALLLLPISPPAPEDTPEPALPTVDCVADGTPALQEGSERLCKTGLFERVHATVSDDQKTFRSYVALNSTGHEAWKTDRGHMRFFLVFGPMVNTMASHKVDARVEFRYNGDVLGSCSTNLKKGITVCELFKGTKA